MSLQSPISHRYPTPILRPSAIRRTLSRARPRDAVHGEEMGDTGWGPRRWVIPIDGTKNFVRGVPVWATLIALMVGDRASCRSGERRLLGRRWWASLGGGAYAGKSLMSASQIHVSNVATIEDASLSYASISAWVESHQGQQFVDLLRRCWRTRAYSDLVLHAARRGRRRHRVRAFAGAAIWQHARSS